MQDLKTEYVDLLLLHYSHCFGTLCKKSPEGTWKDSWRALEDLVREGKVLAIGMHPHTLQFSHLAVIHAYSPVSAATLKALNNCW